MNIFCINGLAGSGKDTFCEMVGTFQKSRIISTVDLCKDILKGVGWNGHTKGIKERDALKKLKIILSEYNDAPFTYTKNRVREAKSSGVKSLFLMVREYHDILRYQEEFDAKSILVTRQGITSIELENAFMNEFPPEYKYDYRIVNDFGYGGLMQQVKMFIVKSNIRVSHDSKIPR